MFHKYTTVAIAVLSVFPSAHAADDYPHPADNPDSTLMLQGPWVPESSHDIDFATLPRIPSKLVTVSDARPYDGVHQHNYLAFWDGKYWAMWSDGPAVEDMAGQRVSYATSEDGLEWSEKQYMTPIPPNSGPDSEVYNTRSPEGFRWISRGLWKRGDDLIALASLDESAGFFGPSLELHAFKFNKESGAWDSLGVIYDDAINNFAPKKLPTGEWMMTRRSHKRDVYMLVGGVDSVSSWESFHVVYKSHKDLSAEEPYWWTLPDNNLVALFRDNNRSGYLYRAFSADHGRSWSEPVRTNFPDARSKFNGLQMSDGRYVLVSNANPKKRDPLVLSISDDGMVFNKMGYLTGGRHIDYPHVIEHDGHLLVAFAGWRKQTCEVLKIRIADLSVLDVQEKN